MGNDTTPEKTSQDHLIHAPNFTPIPNVIFDYWMKLLTSAEFKVLMCLCTKTFDWGDVRDFVLHTQLMRLTGMQRDSVKTSVDKMETLGFLIKSDNAFYNLGETFSKVFREGGSQ